KDSPAAFGLRHAACAAGFVVLATMNAAGYRYAASDQAFYIPAILRHLDPALFPRDAALIDAQARLIAFDEMGAAMVRATGLSLQHLFLALYVGTLLLLYTGIAWIASRLYATRWAAVALAAALTLRHAIAKTGANTLEGYFHPRELAFALGLIAVGAFLDRRWFLIPALLVAGALFHPTTSAWFAFWLSVAAWARVPAPPICDCEGRRGHRRRARSAAPRGPPERPARNDGRRVACGDWPEGSVSVGLAAERLGHEPDCTACDRAGMARAAGGRIA